MDTMQAFYASIMPRGVDLGATEIIYPSAQIAELKAAWSQVGSNIQGRGAVDQAISFGQYAQATIKPLSSTIDPQRAASATRIGQAISDLQGTSARLLGGLPDRDAINPTSWSNLQQKMLYLYGLAWIESAQYPESAKGYIDQMSASLLAHARQLPAYLMSLPGKLVKAAGDLTRDVWWQFIKSYWPFLAVGGVIVVGTVYAITRVARSPEGREIIRAAAPMLIPGGPAVKAAMAAKSLQGTCSSRHSRRGTVLLGDLYFHPRG